MRSSSTFASLTSTTPARPPNRHRLAGESGAEAGRPAPKTAGQVVAVGGGQARDVVVDELQVLRDELAAGERGRGDAVRQHGLAPIGRGHPLIVAYAVPVLGGAAVGV